MRLRKTAVGALVSLTLLLGWAGFYFRDPPAPPSSIEFTPAYQNEGLLKRAWALPVARLYGPQGYLFQSNPSVCGPTSIADILRSEGRPADPSSVMNGSGIWRKAKRDGSAKTDRSGNEPQTRQFDPLLRSRAPR